MKKWCHNGNPFVFVDSFIIREETWGYKKKEKLSFPIFIIYSLADKRKMSPANVYENIKFNDVLHTQGVSSRKMQYTD